MKAGRGARTAGGLARHVPVMLPDVLEAMAPRGGGIIVDGTFGGGGYTRALLEAADCRVVAIDRDPAAIEAGQALVRQFAPRLELVEGRFSEMETLLAARGIAAVDGVVLDVGVSSRQLDDAARGFSFQCEGPLDMRMGGEGPSARDVVNGLGEAELARMISVLGEERRARAVARAIVAARENAPIETTLDLARIVSRVIGHPPGAPRSRIHPATRTFQALRIFVNGELDELVGALAAAERLLRKDGRLVVVSFHSLEDRIVKRFLAERTGREASVSRHRPEPAKRPDPSFRLIGRAVRHPRAHEIETNPRARSARLRAAERTCADPWPLVPDALGVADAGVTLGDFT